MSKVTFLHTADMHFEAKKPDRLEALDWTLAKAKEWDAALIISGDLFNTDQDAQLLHGPVSEIFGAYQDVPAFIIPGNYDSKAFASGADYGDNVSLLWKTPFAEAEFRGIRLVGVPHQANSCLTKAINSLDSSGVSVLIVHGTFFNEATLPVRQEAKRRGADFFPVYLDDIEGNDIVYVAMGHYHSGFMSFDNHDKKICYPGSPISLDESEIGLRKVAKVDIDSESGELNLTEHTVEVGSYKLRAEFTIFPGREADALRAVVNYLSQNRDKRADVKIELHGILNIKVSRLDHALRTIMDKYEKKFYRLNIINNAVSYQHILDRHLPARDFIERLEKCAVSEPVKNRAIEFGLRAFSS